MAEENFWTQGQVAEMALDSYFQQQRMPLVALANCAATVRLPGERRWRCGAGMKRRLRTI